MDLCVHVQQMREYLLSSAFVLDQYVILDLNSVSSLNQQSADRQEISIGNIVLISSQPVFALSPYCCVLSRATTNSNFTFFGVTRSGVDTLLIGV